ncbi:ricin-type beta-trefoil lectin domain protein [Streptomyces cadmiisoli]|uniref:ricin-type beta-trefoil lectin domain protein n=1 Tax=Streptomyces cadmiisoli TaxID=2184053 RepID=UPI0036464F2B
MTRSAQQTPAPSEDGAESGSDGEKTAATAVATTRAESGPGLNSEPAETKAAATSGGPVAARPRTPVSGAGQEAGEDEATEPGTGPESGTASAPRPESGTAPDTRSEAANTPVTRPETESAPANRSETEADPGAAAAAKSRLPSLVRTMTATAIGRPQQQSGPVGRPGKAMLAGAAVAGALLVSVPFLVLAGNDDKDAKATPAGGTVLGGGSQDAPGEFVVTEPEAGSSGSAEKESAKPGKPARKAPAGIPARDTGGTSTKQDAGQGSRTDGGADQQEQPKKQTDKETSSDQKTSSGGDDDEPAKTGSGVTFSAPVSFRSHLSGRCVDVPAGDFSDGQKLFVWDCNNGAAQKWRFASDGTIRIKDKCLDVANANFNNGSPIQIAWCNGNAAQQFTLNDRHDLVNTVVGKCVDIKDNNRGNGAWLQLWSCAGTDNQKWSV